jgi:alanine racemase
VTAKKSKRRPSGLKNKPHSAWLELDADRLQRNIRSILEKVQPARLIVAVKANAYGHGTALAARAAVRAGAMAVAVFGRSEARAAIDEGAAVLNLAYPFEWDVPELVSMGVMQSVWDEAAAARLDQEARRRKTRVAVHLKIDTGMRRVGVPVERAEDLARRIRSMSGLKLAGLFTTFSERSGDAKAQQRGFERACRAIDPDSKLLKHAATTGGLNKPELYYDAARVGLACYDSVLRLRARLIDIKRLEPGETCGYGELFKAERPMTIGVASCGWADGLARGLSHRWRAEYNGRTVPVVGRISANHSYADLTGLKPRVGDVVTLLGGSSNSIPDAAQTLETSVYEVLTRLSPTLPRILE